MWLVCALFEGCTNTQAIGCYLNTAMDRILGGAAQASPAVVGRDSDTASRSDRELRSAGGGCTRRLHGAMAESGEAVEQTLLIVRSVDIYKVPPRARSGGFKSGEWLVSDKLWSGRMRVVDTGGCCEVRLEDVNRRAAHPSPRSLTRRLVTLTRARQFHDHGCSTRS